MASVHYDGKMEVGLGVSTGVVIGRFQVPYLHDGHIHLINTADEHDRLIILVGVSPALGTARNPLDFHTRYQMLCVQYPNALVFPVADSASDEIWSERVDAAIDLVTPPGGHVVIYTGESGCLHQYSGRHETVAVAEDMDLVSGTDLRQEAAVSPQNDEAFRAGVIWSTHNRYPHVYPTVDVAVFNEDRSKLLLAQKTDDGGKWRFIGGFADPSSPSYEADARREVSEEAGIVITDPEWVGSTRVNDWRYSGTGDTIKTMLFDAKYQSGIVRAADDIVKACWHEYDDLRPEHFVESHKPLFELLKEKHEQSHFGDRFLQTDAPQPVSV